MLQGLWRLLQLRDWLQRLRCPIQYSEWLLAQSWGGAADMAHQLWVEKRDLNCLDWGSVAIGALSGLLGSGVGALLGAEVSALSVYQRPGIFGVPLNIAAHGGGTYLRYGQMVGAVSGAIGGWGTDNVLRGGR
jgi:hypothetical protein